MSENPGPEDLETPETEEQGTAGPDTGPGAPKPGEDEDSGRASEDSGRASEDSGQVSEAGGTTLNEETAQGGADALPDSHG